jgi:hypothetical protein
MEERDEKHFETKLQVVLFILTIIIILSTSYYLYYLYFINNNNDNNHYFKAPGDFSKLYLQDNEYTELLIEVDFAEGIIPDNESLDHLVEVLNDVCDKNKIQYVLSDEIDLSYLNSRYSIQQIADLEKEFRDYQTANSTAVIYLLYLNGEYEESDLTLGVSYHASAFAIFKEQILNIEIPLAVRRFVTQDDFETSVVVHETGHLLGLVNINYQSDSAHEDTTNDSPHHCIYEDCVMFYALEHSRQNYMDKIWQREELKPPNTFGQYCRSDLAKLKSGEF